LANQANVVRSCMHAALAFINVTGQAQLLTVPIVILYTHISTACSISQKSHAAGVYTPPFGGLTL